MRIHRKLVVTALLLALPSLTAGCGDNDEAGPSSRTDTPTAAPTVEPTMPIPTPRRRKSRRSAAGGRQIPASTERSMRFSAATMATLHKRLSAATTSIRPTATKIITFSKARAVRRGR